ncbi:dihydrofolate reductase family protein [Streptomyces flavofungini]|uniref:Dihydrofolate reductase family protein n=1 Tax=Streptomyces flavofungini TaxID=68200 RepID=A0ABS0X0K5_9ACTN|nr:dihydrofolate reductase family protein [Streptomyces flavofungini]MBJ3806715.1 dihydrofolate reductase family protein [Streptomyces flavofungini]GHC61012.1 dihydrofolate reductase [Streptomyces flavofungini]
MRDLIITQNITLDGVIDATDGWFAPADDSVDQSDLNEALLEQAARADAFLVGRVTFEDMRGYWPQQTNDTTGVTDYLNKVQKYVVSTTLQDPQWANTTVLSGDLKENITALKSQPGKDIVTTGSIRLTHALIEADLVDEFRLFVYPVVLGHGARLFDRHKTDLHLMETRRFTSGVTLLRYRVA